MDLIVAELYKLPEAVTKGRDSFHPIDVLKRKKGWLPYKIAIETYFK